MSDAVRALSFLILAAATVTAGCDDDPFGYREWTADPDTASIHSLRRPELAGLPSAFNFGDASGPHGVVVEIPTATGQWDVVLSEQQGGLVLAPAGAFPELPEAAGIATVDDVAFQDVTQAPGDTEDYVRSDAVPLQADRVYVVRSRPVSTLLGTCVYFAKLEPVALDTEAGRFEFAYVWNPNCNSRALDPSEEDR